MEKITYTPQGVCARQMTFEVEDEIIKKVNIEGGCPGNALGISVIMVGKTVKEVVDTFSGLPCGKRATSCPDQISIALSKHLEKKQ